MDSIFGNDRRRRTQFEVVYFLSSFGVRSSSRDFTDRVGEELGLQTASEPELEQIRIFIRQLSQPDGRPASARDAAAILTTRFEEWKRDNH